MKKKRKNNAETQNEFKQIKLKKKLDFFLFLFTLHFTAKKRAPKTISFTIICIEKI
jgi:hypothetical protein